MSERRIASGLAILQRSDAVEASLWRRLREQNDQSCRLELFTRYTSLARAIARYEHRRRPAYGLERADFEQLAFGGLLEAIDRFDPVRSVRFGGFAKHRIRGSIADGLGRSSESGAQYKHRRRIELERLRSIDDGQSPSFDPIADLSDIAVMLALGLIAEGAYLAGGSGANAESGAPELTGYDTLAWRDLELSLLREIDALPETEKTIMQQHYLHGLEFQLIARMLGLSRGRVSQLHRSALLKVRERLRITG